MNSSFSTAKRKSALVYYLRFVATPGGSEYLPLLLIAELQQRGYDVTLALDYESDLEQAARIYEIDLDVRKVRMAVIKPSRPLIRRIDNYIPFCRTMRLKKLAKKADICISANNMYDFGKPAHHVVFLLKIFGDNAFYDFVMHRPPLTGFSLFKRKLRTFLAETLLRPALGVRSTRKILKNPGEHIYVPSRYVASIMQAFYGPFNCTVFYPPTTFILPSMDVPRDPLRIIYLGRFDRNKRIQDIIDIAERARMLTNTGLELHFAGNKENDPFAEAIQDKASDKPWVHFIGPVYGNEKASFLLSGSYAIHAERDEAFGISITEYLKAGCIPIVPDEGGTPEVVGNPALTYHTNEDAARILARLLTDEAFRQEQLNHCRERAKDFSFERYLESQHKILDTILERQL